MIFSPRLNKKVFIVLLFAVAMVSLFPAGTIHAQTTPPSTVTPPSGLDCFTHPPAGCIYYASYVIDSFLGMFISMGAVVIKFALAINANVFNSPTVQKGFSVTLALANLGFVIGIIVIALATILRNETYGIKQLLWKLIVMAILVNFGLVITAPILGFADNLSNYFLTATGGSGGLSGDNNGFVTNLTAAFQPHVLTNPPEKMGDSKNGCFVLDGEFGIRGGSIASILCNYTGTAKSKDTPEGLFSALMALLFAAVFESIVLITFWAIGILLIVRYAYIGILLILLPLAWLTWIFPKFNSNFEKWWQEFIRWAFFPAITLFFIYLAFQAVSVNGQGNVVVPQAAIQASGVTGPEISVTFATDAASLLQTALDEILLCALCIGGLFAANSMGIKGAGTAIGAAKWAGGQVTGYAGKQSKKAARAGFHAAGGQKVVDRLRTGRLGGLEKIPVAGWAATRLGSIAGRAAQPHLDNKALVEEAKKHVPENPEEIKQNLRGNMNTETKLAHIAKLIEKNELDSTVMVGRQSIKDFMDANKDVLEANYGQGKTIKDFDKNVGSNKDMREAERNLSKFAARSKASVEEMKNLKNATEEFVSKLQKSDISKMNVNDAFGKDSPITRSLANAFATQNPALAASALPKMKGPALKKFSEIYSEEIRKEQDQGPYAKKVAAVKANATLTEEEKKRVIEKLTMSDQEKTLAFAMKSFESALGNNAAFGAPEAPGATSAASTSPTAGEGH